MNPVSTVSEFAQITINTTEQNEENKRHHSTDHYVNEERMV